MAAKKGGAGRGAHKKEVGKPEATSEPYELNSRIIALLQQDGRMPYSTIATALGVSEGTVRNRVRQLVDDNVITIQAEALPQAFGYRFNAMTFIKVAGGVDVDALIERLYAVPEVFYLVMMMGRHDIGVATYHQSHDDYLHFLRTHCYGRPDIASTETSLVLKVHKMKLQWDLEDNGHPPVLSPRISRKD